MECKRNFHLFVESSGGRSREKIGEDEHSREDEHSGRGGGEYSREGGEYSREGGEYSKDGGDEGRGQERSFVVLVVLVHHVFRIVVS